MICLRFINLWIWTTFDVIDESSSPDEKKQDFFLLILLISMTIFEEDKNKKIRQI